MFLEALQGLWASSGFVALTGQHFLMLTIACVLIYLAIVRKFEPLLLLPISFGILLVNLPLSDLMGKPSGLEAGGLLYYLYQGVKLGIYPSLIFLGIGAMTDFGPLIARPSSLFLGAGAQFGICVAFVIATALGFTPPEGASIAIIGGADGPTAIFLTTKLAPRLLPAIAIAAYSYMALIPMIQPPIMNALTTQKEREVVMKQLRNVSKMERVCFPIIVTILCVLLLPSVAPLIGMLMLGNLFRESGVVERLSETAQNALINIVTIFLGLTVGATMGAEVFLTAKTLGIFALGFIAICGDTAFGVFGAKLMNLFSKQKINPLIGASGISAFPMSARVAHKVGNEANPQNYLLMHAMGVNTSGQIGSVLTASVMIAVIVALQSMGVDLSIN